MNETSAVSVKVLRSSSSGNSTLIWNREHAIMVDCGLGPRVTEELLAEQGFSMKDLAGVLVTHAHNDHGNVITIERFFRYGVPVFCSSGVKKVIARDLPGRNGEHFRTFSRESFTVGSFKVTSFEVDHDSEGGCFGFCIFSGTGQKMKKISLATDCGSPDKRLAEQLLDSHIILIASNYDCQMIDGPSPVPAYVKERHIRPYQPSNDQCADVLVHVAKKSEVRPEAIYLLHISKNHNTVDKAVSHSQAVLRNAGYRDIRVLPTYRDSSSETICL
jgi:phosphoribosyl 1,2-cyclic phosphodiesterase